MNCFFLKMLPNSFKDLIDSTKVTGTKKQFLFFVHLFLFF